MNSDHNTKKNLPTSSPDGLDMQTELVSLARLLGRKWHLVIINQLLEAEALGFNDLKTRIDLISGKVLSESLDDLEQKGIVERTVVSERPFRVEYSLTEKGQKLEPIVQTIRTEIIQNGSVVAQGDTNGEDTESSV
jgi:DNA-binding HxlR family transcriptional regulator